ncbi:MAG: 3-phosphoshikimate 1-carboxyvinyltransferase [Candidatus Cloacimonetes bacterium]|nr:3-phosphoshikimate 1-carboxyvinyltransferase [Candidatus Cloacimonadota bacterium]
MILADLGISGSVRIQASKSILSRLLIISTYLREGFEIRNFSECLDVVTLIENLTKLGLRISDSEKSNSSRNNQKEFEEKSIIFQPQKQKEYIVKITDSAAAARFLMSRLCGIQGIKVNFDVSEQLTKRPFRKLIDALVDLGAQISGEGFPYQIEGCEMRGGSIEMDASISSQFISALLLSAPSYRNDLIIKLPNKPVSNGYLQMTIEVMNDFGVEVQYTNGTVLVKSGQSYKFSGSYQVEPDFSSACYFWALGCFSEVGIGVESGESTTCGKSLQPDFGFLNILKEIGAVIEISDKIITVRKRQIHGIRTDMNEMPDQVPTLAAIALFADSPTFIENIEHLTYKESNRIEMIVSSLTKIGAKAEFKDNILSIFPLKSLDEIILTSVDCGNDHRIYLMLFLIRLISGKNLGIIDHKCLKKSFPNFHELLTQLKINSASSDNIERSHLIKDDFVRSCNGIS